jgi:hypothetical protein
MSGRRNVRADVEPRQALVVVNVVTSELDKLAWRPGPRSPSLCPFGLALALAFGAQKAAYNRQRRNEGVTELIAMPERGHALTIDAKWRAVAETALTFVKRFA